MTNFKVTASDGKTERGFEVMKNGTAQDVIDHVEKSFPGLKVTTIEPDDRPKAAAPIAPPHPDLVNEVNGLLALLKTPAPAHPVETPAKA